MFLICMSRLSNFILISIVLCTVGVLFYRGLFNFYFQDDFIHLTLGWINNRSDLIKLIAPVTNFPYRPIAIQILSFIAVSIFNLNPLPSHLLLFILHGLNIVLLWTILSKLAFSKFPKFFTVFLYATSSVHFMLLYWWSIVYMLLGTTLMLLNILLFESIEKSYTFSKLSLFFLIFFLMLITNEALIIFPLFIIAYSHILQKTQVKKLIIPSFLFSILFALLRLNIAQYPLSGDYRIGKAAEVFKTGIWYFFRSLNLPEGIRMMTKGSYISVFLLLILIRFLILLIFIKNIKYLTKDSMRLIAFGAVWYLIFAFPFFLLPNHLSPFYLNTALIGFMIALETLIFPIKIRKINRLSGFLASIVLGMYGLLSFVNVQFLNKTHWVIWRAQLAKFYLEKTIRTFPTLPQGVTIVYKDTKVDPSEIAVVFSGNKALRLYYHDPLLNVVYGRGESQYIISD